MNPREEIESIRRRLSAVEYDVGQLKQRLEYLEARIVPVDLAISPPTAPQVAPALTVPSQSVEREIVSPAAPPVLPPVIAPAAQPTAESVEPPVVASPQPNPMREWLEPLQLWPPSGEDNAEVRLAAWWATRVGALLAVIGIVFLGIYVSRNSPPWVRLTEIVGVTAGVLLLGGWLERKLPKFGAVVFGAGLALAYFCAFAAYAVPPMKVIANPLVATVCELGVVGGILAMAWWRGSQVVATMAVALGHVTAFLALRSESSGFGPWVVLLLGVAGVALRLARNWQAPTLVAMPLAWMFLAFAAATRGSGISIGAAWFWATLYFVLYLMRDWLAAWRGMELTQADRVVQVTNSSLAVAVGLFVTAQFGQPQLTSFYFGSGVIMLAAAAAWLWTRRAPSLVSIFVCKGTGLIALGVISEFEGHTRSLVLIAQAFVMLVSARQSSVRGLRIATVITAAVALGFFMSDLRSENAPLWVGATLAEVAFLVAGMAFVAALQRWLAFDAAKTAFAAVLVGLAAISASLTWDTAGWAPALQLGLGAIIAAAAIGLRGWIPGGVSAAMLFAAAHVQIWIFDVMRYSKTQLWLNELALLAAAAVFGVGLHRWQNGRGQRLALGWLTALASSTLIAVFFDVFPETLALGLAATISAALGFTTGVAKRWPLAALSAPVLAVGVAFFLLGENRGAAEWYWLAALAAWSAPAWLVAAPERIQSIETVAWRNWALPTHAMLATLLTLLALERNVSRDALPLACAVAAIGVFALAWRPGLKPALECSWVLWLAALIHVSDRGDTALSWIAFALSWLPAVAIARFGVVTSKSPPWREIAEQLQVMVASMIGLVIAFNMSGALRLAGFGFAALAAFAAWRWAGVASGRIAVLVIACVGWVVAAILSTTPEIQGWRTMLFAVLSFGLGVAVVPFFLERGYAVVARNRLRWSGSVAALVLVYYAFGVQRGPVADYATVGWGILAVALFLLGLFARSRPHRLSGLAGLALCIPRAFVVDLHSTLHRIVAFVALGVVLLWVGFSYHRFRHLISDDEKKL